MKKTITKFTSLLTILILFGNMVVNAQSSEIWNITPDWNTGLKDYRGIAYNADNNHLYVAGTIGSYTNANVADSNKLKVLDASSGELLKTLTLDTLTLTDNGYGIRDVEVSSDGGIFAIITTTNQYNPQKLYYWANEDAKAVELWEDASGDDIDFAPGFSVYGDYSTEALIIIPFNDVAKVYYFEVVSGVLGNASTLDLTASVTGGTGVHVQALGTKITNGFWYSNSVTAPSLIDGTGAITGSIDAAIFSGATGDVKQFTAANKTLLAVSDQGAIKIIDISGATTDFSNITIDDTVETITGTAALAPGWPPEYGDGQEQVAVGYADTAYTVFSISGGNYIKALATPAAPTATDLAFAGYAMVDSTLTLSYTYNDINNDGEGTTEIKWYLSDDVNGTNKTEITANAGNLTYNPVYSDLGKFISATVLPFDTNGTSYAGYLVETALIEITAEAHKPIASNLQIVGDANVFSTLTASYTFTDADNDAEGESILKWWRADDANGTNAVEIAADTLLYKIIAADTSKFIIFSVTPVSVSPNMSTGDSIAIATTTAVLFPAFAPVASEVAISGIEEVTRVLTGTYNFSDLNDDAEGESILTWYRADALDGTKTTVATDTNIYELIAADEGKYIFFGVTPVAVSNENTTGEEVFDTTGVIAPQPEESAPVASDVVVSGTPEVGALLSATYTYFDYTEDLEGVSIYKWYVADDANGTNATLIEGAVNRTYLVPEEYIGKYFIFEVTPVALTGGLLEGLPVQDTTTIAVVESSNSFGLERMWMASTKTGALPWYLGTGSTERGLAVGSEHIYIASRNGGTRVMIIDKEDGSYVGELNTEGMDDVAGSVFHINDVEVSDDGQILAAPLVDGTSFWIFKWADELSAPVKWIEVTLDNGMRLGDKFTVTGDVSGDAVIYAAASASMSGNVIRWKVTGGIPGDAEIFTLTDFPANISVVAIQPFSLDTDANILVDGKGVAPAIYTSTGTIIESIPMVDDYTNYKIQSNSPNIFNYKGRTMAAFFQAMRQDPLGSRVLVLDITTSPFQIVDSSEYISNNMPWNGYLGELDITVDENYYYATMMQANNGIAQFRGEMLLPEFVSAETSHDGNSVIAVFSKTINDTTVASLEPWTIMSGSNELAIASITSAGANITFTLSSPAVEGEIVTVAYDGTGSVISFDGMPLGAFGPVEVINLTGADVPVVSNVAISGTPRTNEVLTGTYDFTDPDGDLEGTSTYQWYSSDNADGSDAVKIIGEFSQTYTVTSDQEGKYVAFEVTPVSATGGEAYLVGEPVKSEYIRIIPTSVEDVIGTQLSIYPNPAKNIVNIDGAENVSSVTIYDITGRVMLNYVNTKESTIKLNVTNFKSGIYLVQMLDSNGKIEISRIVKN